MAQHEMTRHETRECAFYILFEMQFQNDTAEELFQVAEEADLLPITDAVKEMVNGVVAHEAELKLSLLIVPRESSTGFQKSTSAFYDWHCMKFAMTHRCR